MSKISLIVPQLLLGEYKKTVKLGQFSFTVYAPTLQRIVDMFGSYSSLDNSLTKLGVLAAAPEGVDQIAKVLATAICKHRIGRKYLVRYIMKFASLNQIKEAASMLSMDLISGKELFESVTLDPSETDTKNAIVKGNKTIIGQVATFMENLHLNRKEVFEEIPYIGLLLMSADKLRVEYPPKEGEEGEEGKDVVVSERKVISGKELLKRRRNG